MSIEVIYRDPKEIKEDYKRMAAMLKSADISDDTRKVVAEAIVKLKQEKEPLTKLSYGELEETLVDMFKLDKPEQLLMLLELCKLEFEQLLSEQDYAKYSLSQNNVEETIVNLNKAKQAALEKTLSEGNSIKGVITVLDIVCTGSGIIIKNGTNNFLVLLTQDVYAVVDENKILVKRSGEMVSIPKTTNIGWNNGWRIDIPNKFDKNTYSFKNKNK